MSKGFGKLQTDLISVISENQNNILLNRLIWIIADKKKAIAKGNQITPDVVVGNIDQSFYKSIQRSIITLEKDSHIKRTKIKVQDLQDVIDYYPYKTTRLEILSLRKILLPELVKYIDNNHKYDLSLYDIEKRQILLLKESDITKYNNCISEWRTIQNLIIQLLNKKTSIQSELLTSIFIKGMELFVDRDASYKQSFEALVEKLTKSAVIDNTPESILVSRIKIFKDHYFKIEHINYSLTKGQLYNVAELGGKGSASLKNNVKDYLLQSHESLIRNLPGHKDGKTIMGLKNYGVQYSPILNQLVDRHVLSPFIFLSLNKSS